MAAADGFQVLGTRAGTAWLGGTNTQPIVIVEAQTLPDLVYFEVNVPQVDYSASSGRGAAAEYANIINGILILPNVAGIYWSQGPGKNDELTDMLNILVQSASGNSEAYLPGIPISLTAFPFKESAVTDLSEQLTATEG